MRKLGHWQEGNSAIRFQTDPTSKASLHGQNGGMGVVCCSEGTHHRRPAAVRPVLRVSQRSGSTLRVCIQRAASVMLFIQREQHRLDEPLSLLEYVHEFDASS